jgi:hypothetical protein
MKKKIIICGIIMMLIAISIPTVNATNDFTPQGLVNVAGDIGISDLTCVAEVDNKSGTLYLWWKTNTAAKETPGLNVNISVDGRIIGTASANTHFDLESAWSYDEFGAIFETAETYTIKVEFIDFLDPDGKNVNTKNDETQRTIYVGEGILSDILNSVYGLYFLTEQAIPDTGIDFLDDLPFLPIIILIFIVVIAYLLYRRSKKKKAKKTRPMRPIPPRNLGQQRRDPMMGRVVNPYERKYPPYGPTNYFDDEYY